jgi:hypothetical protein
MPRITGYSSLLAALLLIASCSAGRTPSSSSSTPHEAGSTPRSSSSSQVRTAPTTFTSAAYGYTLTVPAGWTSTQAFDKWNGESELDGTSDLVDVFGQPSVSRGIFVAAAPWKRDLAAYARFLITWNAYSHGDYCPRRPTMRNPVSVGGRPGVLLAYNCGILVNNVATVHHGVGYVFVFIDRHVAAATDPSDHATFVKVLRSVQFPK